MNVLYALAFPSDPARVGRVKTSIEQCLAATAIDASVHAEIARIATTLLALASGWSSDPGGQVSLKIEAHDGACAVWVEAKRADGRALVLSGNVTA